MDRSLGRQEDLRPAKIFEASLGPSDIVSQLENSWLLRFIQLDPSKI